MDHLDAALGYFIPEPVEPQIEVLHAAMMLGIFRNRERREVVDPELGGLGDLVPELREQVAKPEDLLPGRDRCDELRLRGGERNNGLETTRPGDRTCAHLDDIARGRATCVRAASMVRIGV